MLNIFLDTTLLYNDPFLKSVSNSTLLKLITELKGTIFISTVVIKEVKHHLKINLETEESQANKNIKKINQLRLNTYIERIELDLNSILKNLDEFYNQLVKKGIVVIIDFENSLLPEIVNRAIERKKPFSENKDEFRDTIIWLSYCKHINKKSLKNCFFITNNTKDFYDKDNKTLHAELHNDFAEMNMCKSSKELIASEDIQKMTKILNGKLNLETWIDKNPIDSKNVCKILEESCLNDIFDKINIYLFDGNFPSKFNDFADHLELSEIEIISADWLFHQIIEEEIYISGQLQINIEVMKKIYNSVRESGEELYIDSGSITAKLKIDFSFNHKGEQGFQEIDLGKVSEFVLS